MKKNTVCLYHNSIHAEPTISYRKKTKKLYEHKKNNSSMVSQTKKTSSFKKQNINKSSQQNRCYPIKDSKIYHKQILKNKLIQNRINTTPLQQINNNVSQIKAYIQANYQCSISHTQHQNSPQSIKLQSPKIEYKKTEQTQMWTQKSNYVQSLLADIQSLNNRLQISEYQKQYLRHKATFLQVQNRELVTKMEQLGKTISSLQLTKTQQLLDYSASSRLKLENQYLRKQNCIKTNDNKQLKKNKNLLILGNLSKKSNSCLSPHVLSSPKTCKQNNKQQNKSLKSSVQPNTDNLSSLLISLSNSYSHRHKIFEAQSDYFPKQQTVEDMIAKVQQDFTKLLDYINRQTNQQRKIILRKMLSMKAKTLKKYSVL